jgi:iron(III) transport system substrate-binding protein
MRTLIALLLAALSAGAAADDARLEQARREGEVVWYTAMNVPDAEAVRKPFLERYPFLKLTIVRSPGEKVRMRILMEARAGRYGWDVVSFNLLDIDVLNREGLLAAYVSPETRNGFPRGAVDPAGRWAAIYVRQYVIGYNTQLVKPADAPKTWQDLLAPRWAGKFALDEGDVEWYAAMLDYWGSDKGRAYMRALAAQRPQQRRGHHLLTRLLSAGEYPLALVHANEVEKDKEDGAPVEWVKTLDPTITSPSQAAISAKAPHPAAARLLVDFLLSKEGQKVIRSRGRVPARTDLERGSEDAAQSVFYVDPRLAPKFADYESEFHAIFDKAR